jgi:putative ABC transport system permease protein
MKQSIETLLSDIRFAVRGLRKQPVLTGVAILTLALGIGANTAMFSVINTVLLRPLPYPNPDRLVWMNESGDEVANRMLSYPNFIDWSTRNHTFEAMSTYRTWSMTVTGVDQPINVNAGMVAADYFKVMGTAPVRGRAFAAEDDRPGATPVTIISYAFWQKYFAGDTSVVGKTIALDDSAFTIIGVMPQDFAHQGPPPLWVPIGPMNWKDRDVRIGGNVIGRMKPGITIAQARADISAVARQLAQEHPVANAGANRVNVLSLQERLTGNVRTPLWILFGAVGLVLLIACGNLANLMLARAVTRRREFAIRAAMGATRARVVRQLLVESVLLALLGGAAGLIVASWSMAMLAKAAREIVPRLDQLHLNYRVLTFNLAVSVASGIIFGLAPAWRFSKPDLQETLKDNTSGSGERQGKRLRGGLVIAEIALATILLAGAGLLIRSLIQLANSNVGFDSQNVLTFELNVARSRYRGEGELARFQQQILDGVSALPGVESASISVELPGGGSGWTTDISTDGHVPRKPGELINVDWAIVSRDYFRTMRIPILRGRTFTRDEDAGGKPVVLVDENLARKFWPDEDAIGKHIGYDSPTAHEIIGIVKEVGIYGSAEKPLIKIYTPLGRAAPRGMVLSVRGMAADSSLLAPAVANSIHALDKDLPISELATFDQLLSRDASPRRLNTGLLSLFALLALLLAATGIYGVLAYSVAQRTREVGVRMALGAVHGDVLRLFVVQGMKLVLIGLVIGLLGAFAFTRLMTSLLFGVKPTDAVTFISIAVALVAAALPACYLPARRATKVDPLTALRYE